MTLVELCCGTAAVSLWALAELAPLTGYMGGKRRDASLLVELLGARRPGRVVLVDAGPWGGATLRHERYRIEVARLLREWDRRGELPEVWPTLLYPPPDDPAECVAQYLCLQARTAGVIPMLVRGLRTRARRALPAQALGAPPVAGPTCGPG